VGVLLFDIDGTLTPGPDGNHQAAVVAALRDVFDERVTVDEFRRPEFQGLTTPGMALAVLRARGRESEFNGKHSTWAEAMQRRFREHAAEHPEPFADAAHAVEAAREAGHPTGLLTGNYKIVANLKLAAVGLWSLFDPNLSGFGDDGSDRDAVAMAANERIRTRCGPDTPVCVIGDTPRDIACARAINARVIAVSTGDFHADDLVAADAVFPTLQTAVQFAIS
jgi:phosphoglycolate phosphatase-like HAD superfamily hydrolase